ncbi:hypothetical protein SLEP1_g60418, partial [Rubroshorea leprosula]
AAITTVPKISSNFGGGSEIYVKSRGN